MMTLSNAAVRVSMRPGTASPMTRFARRRGRTSDTMERRITSRFTKVNAKATAKSVARSVVSATRRARQTDAMPSASNHAHSAYAPVSRRPASSEKASAAPASARARRSVMLYADALRFQPPLHLAANLGKPRLGHRLEAHDEDRLGVGGADEPPPVAKQDARSVHGDHVVVEGEILLRRGHDLELAVVRAIHA